MVFSSGYLFICHPFPIQLRKAILGSLDPAVYTPQEVINHGSPLRIIDYE